MNKKLLFSLALAVVLVGGIYGTANAECGLCGIHWPSCLSLCNFHLPTCFTCGGTARDLDRDYSVAPSSNLYGVAPDTNLYFDRDLDKGTYIGGNPDGFTTNLNISDRDMDRDRMVGTVPGGPWGGSQPYRYNYNVRMGLTNDFGQDKTERF